jgi:hygromycin-B 4-O-kinase
MKELQDRDFRKFLIERLQAAPESIETIRPGEWSRAYAIRRNGEELVVRFSSYRDDFEKDRAAARWTSTNLPIPPVMELGEAFGVAYAVTPRVHGAFLENVASDEAAGLLPTIFRALDAAQDIDLSSATGFGLWTAEAGGIYPTWREALLTVGESVPPGRLPNWRAGLETSPSGIAPFNEAYELMRTLVHVCPEERHPIHNDLLNRNVFVAGDQITGVLDWGASMFGDFLYDVASLAFWASWFDGWSQVDFVTEAARHYSARGLVVPHFEERVRCYWVNIGVASMAYDGGKGVERWDHLARVIERTFRFAA